jgi:hypothetical protein
MSFVDFAHQKEIITLRTTVTLQDRTTWFRVQKHGTLDFEKILKRSFEKVFPCHWNKFANKSPKLGAVAATKVTTKFANKSPKLGAVADTKVNTKFANKSPKLGAVADTKVNTIVARWRNVAPSPNHHVVARNATTNHHHHGDFSKPSSRSEISSLNSSLRGMSICEDGEYDQDYIDDDDIYLSGRIKGRHQQYVNINDKSMDLCKHNGFKMMDNGHYGKRRSGGGKKGGRKNDSDYYY